MPQTNGRPHETEVTGAYRRLGVGAERTHAVQFYEDDQFLVASVGDFLATGLALGQRVLAVATAPHRQALPSWCGATATSSTRSSSISWATR